MSGRGIRVDWMVPGFLSEAFLSFQGEGLHVGRRQLFLRFAGCPLRCRYCDTPDSLVRTENFVVRAGESDQIHRNPVTVGGIANAVTVLLAGAANVDGVALTGGEPLAQTEFLVTLLRAQVLPRPLLLETSGTLFEQLARVIDDIDIVSMDIKLPSNTGETPFWDEHRRFLQRAASKAYVKILVDGSTSIEELARAASLVSENAPAAAVFLQPISQRGSGASITLEQISNLYDIVKCQVDDVRVIPQTHKMMMFR